MDKARFKCRRFKPAALDQFLLQWESCLNVLSDELDAKKAEDESFEDYDRQNAVAEWILANFPEPDFEVRWWDTPGVAELTGEWFFNNSPSISPDTDDWNTWVDAIGADQMRDLLLTLTRAYVQVLESDKEDHTGFMTAAPALIEYFAEAMDAGDAVFYCHSCPN